MATLSHIAVYPVDALDPVSVEQCSFTDRGGLAADRTYTIVDADGNPLDGTAALDALRSTVDLESGNVVLRVDDRVPEDDVPGEQLEPGKFHLTDDREDIEDWLSAYFGTDVQLRKTTDSDAGPTLVARATLREVGSWYDLTTAEMRMRVRPNLVVAGVPPFWEDNLVGDSQRVRIGDVTLDGGALVEQSAATSRDPYTGEVLPEFRETFETRRQETLPEWTDPDIFDEDYYRLSVRLSVPESERDGSLAVGDDVELLD